MITLNPTIEQKKIINSLEKHKVLKINAFAGTGKTTTLQLLTHHYETKKFLYLAYNKSSQLEAKNKFERNVEVRTLHSLAYRCVLIYSNLNLKNIENYNAKKFADILKIDYENGKSVLNEFTKYCNSKKLHVNENNPYAKYLKVIIDKLENLEINVSFDYILKKFHILLDSGVSMYKYDVVMLDEAQDSNDVTLEILNLLESEHKVFIGDRHQQIYGFRGSTNAMNQIEGKEFPLTQTFRFPKNIAKYANILLSRFKNETLKIGSNKKVSNFDEIYNDKNFTIGYISRGNAYMIAQLKEKSNKKEKYKTVRHPKEIFRILKDVSYFIIRQYENISDYNNFLKNFKNVKELEIYIDKTKDIELGRSMKLFYGLFDSKINNILKLENEALNYYNSEDNSIRIFFTTAHTSKGLEYDATVIADDFFTFSSNICKMGFATYQKYKIFLLENNDIYKKQIEEFNLFYVALTRCKLCSNIESNNMIYLTDDGIELINSELELIKKICK